MTIPHYFTLPALFEYNTLFIEQRETPYGYALICRESIFHPQGGGQPGDQGKITIQGITVQVTDTRMLPSKEIAHILQGEVPTFEKNSPAHMSIDKEKRMLYTKLHAAAHLMDLAIRQLHVPLTPSKGYHFPDSPYVEYSGTIEDKTNLSHLITEVCAKLIQKNSTVTSNLQTNGIRMIQYEEYVAPCSGTHVGSTGEIGSLRITKVSSKKGLTKISYRIE